MDKHEERMNENLARCAQINFENVERAMPFISKHPYYIIAKAQLDEALGGMSVEASLAKHIPLPTVGLPHVADADDEPHGITGRST